MFPVALALAGGLRVEADVLDAWNDAFLNSIRAENTAPPLASRNLAIASLAVFDAVNSLDRAYLPYTSWFDSGGPASAEAAAVAAAYQVASVLFPSRQAAFDALWLQTGLGLPPGVQRENGFALGFAAANAILDRRTADGSNTQIPYIPSNDPGAWRRTPPFYRPPDLPHWGRVTPFALEGADQFRPPGPPALDSEQYAADVNEVKELGGRTSTTRTGYQTETARFWSDFSGTATPPGHWNELVRDIAANEEIGLLEKARLLALVNVAMADAGIAVWDCKYVFNLWRPVTAIPRADEDGNPATEADPTWLPLLNTPAFPEYVSGHSAFSAAAGAVLLAYFGTDALHFSATSDTVRGVTRTYDSVEAVVDEIGMSRIYGGIHFHSAVDDGHDMGREIGEYVNQHYLLPVPEPGTAALLLFGLTGLLARRSRSAR